MTAEVTPTGTATAHSAHGCRWCATWWSTATAANIHAKRCTFQTRQFGAASRTAKAATQKKTLLFYNARREKCTCEGTPVDYVTKFPYLGDMLAGNGAALVDVEHRLGGAMTAWFKIRRSLRDKTLKLHLRLGMYKVCVCSTLRYSSGAWIFNEAAKRRINEFNSHRLAAITGHDVYTMATDPPYCLVTDIRRTRVIWLGHILRYPPEHGTRLALLAYMTAFTGQGAGRTIYPDGSLLEDAPQHKTITELITFAVGDGSKEKRRKRWKRHVQNLRQL